MKYLTKSKFKLATECPTKLFYTGKKQYANTSLDNPFLEALAEGGYQVGELAKYYYPDGHNINTLDYDEALKQTNKLLEQDEVVIYEAAVKYNNLFIRVDILVKRGNYIKLYEVKAKSIDLTDHSFLTKNGKKVLAKWKPYLFDIAFQRYVVRCAFPESVVTAYLYLVNKNSTAPTSGLNQKFQIVEDKNRRKGIKVSSSLIDEDLSKELLYKVPVDEYCDLIFDTDKDFEKPNVLNIWNFRAKDKFIQEGKIKFSDIYEEDIKPDESPTKARQWLQIEKVKNNDESVWLDTDGLKTEMDSWVFPLHFIDFETTAMAIPFNQGRRPYEGIAFQFSHHIVYGDGRIEHKGEYINTERGIFPNYEFVRQLKAQLDKDQGTIFKYSNHENTYLNMIYVQLQSEQADVADKDELCDFIKSITKSKKDSVEKWCGERNMVDMLEVVKDYYYNPATGGSNSIKQVLPATLNSSDYLKEKYSKPIYGTDEIPSKNFKDWTWFKFEDDTVKDPYKLLPLMFQDADKCDDLLNDNNELKDGGAAMTAYARMQFEQMGDYEREELTNSLLKYCELDTFAMVMIYEAWREMVYLTV